jgi:polyisoprenoid-binding protein YceI
MSSTTTAAAPGLVAGKWKIDPVHSEVGFSVRHLMVSKVKGRFTKFEGTVTIGANPAESRVEATIDASSIVTGDEGRDQHLRSADFFDVDNHGQIEFVSRSVRPAGSDYEVDGDLTIKGVTRPVTLALEFNGAGADPWGGQRAGFSASTEINRSDFGVTFNMPLDGGGVVVGEKVKISLEIEAVLEQES